MSHDDWTPLPGMHKLRCADCGRYFASAARSLICPNCRVPSLRKPKVPASASPFDSVGQGYQRSAQGIWRE